VTGNVSMTCRYFGITRPAFYKWLRRHEELGLEGLRDRSRRLNVIPQPPSPRCRQGVLHRASVWGPRTWCTKDGLRVLERRDHRFILVGPATRTRKEKRWSRERWILWSGFPGSSMKPTVDLVRGNGE
jgi:Helix-turn-helix domain